ncbi:hypothetical protein [Methylobacter sp. BlB1]|uniref:hypothetical protein n=1 Tax=Methylobacter sp. BlB1 TaxID=2785914 RepID=UPI0018954F67|nr:hypothetical protein [Methylobacter sp. BlB1]MBF6647851.1 hypothetical protein [Methylobacter sp. BlB1]
MSRIIWLLLITLFLSPAVPAKPLTLEQVPEPLKPWVNWVLQHDQERICPFLYNSYEQKRCSWPTQLSLDITPEKGAFTISWKVYQESWLSLPGDHNYWPLNVTANDKPALVMDKDGRPKVLLEAGVYEIKGQFLWDKLPDNLTIPEDTGLISLHINGNAIQTPIIKDGQLWLKDSDSGRKKLEDQRDSLDLQVFRKIIDDVPLQVLTRMDLEVSGAQREIKLALPLPEGFIPLQLQSPLPARLEPDGQLLVQVRPGRWQIELLARSAGELDAIPFAVRKDWPAEEVWVFNAVPQLRVVEIEDLSALDPSQTNLPEDWKSLPAYRISQGQAMHFKLIRRGDPEPEPNQLNLTRKLWLDFDGTGYTVNDLITGRMTRGWRLNALPRTQLGKVMLDGQSQLITRDADKQGVEVRQGRITLDADSRLADGIGTLSAVGWEQNFHNVNAELNLPPGWRLLAASGVDNVPDSWIARWTLLDLFLVLIAALAIRHLWNPAWGLFALLTLVIIWHEPDAPHFVWLNILAATALIKVLPPGRFLSFMNWYRAVTCLFLVLAAIPFMVDQIRMGLYPQLEQPWQTILPTEYPATAAMAPETMNMEEQAMRKSMPEQAASGAAVEKDEAVNFERIDPNAKIQTGPGLPQWQWTKIQLSWNGAVDSGQELHLWYQPPVMTMLLNFLRVGLIAVLALLMFGVAEKFKFNLKAAMPVLLGFLVLPMLSPQPAHADFPDQAMLDELRNRLLEAPDCLPDCAQIPQMHLAITDKALTLTLKIHARQAVAVPLPAEYEQWFPSQVSVDGKAAQGLYRSGNSLWINLSEGEHQVELSAAPLLNRFTLPLPLKPHHVAIEAAGWQVSGTQEDGRVDGQLQFSRVSQAQEAGKPALEPGVLPPFVSIKRTLQLGLDWRVITQISRISPADSAVVIAVPLLPDESVTTAGVRVKDSKVEVNMPPQQTFMEWQSVLKKTGQIELTAAPTDRWREIWAADVSPIWHIEASGIAMIHQNHEGRWLPEWRPWPGEKVTLKITRPQPVEGQTLTIDDSRLMIKPSKRLQEAELKISLRSSQGAQHTLTLPENAVLQSVMVDGVIQPLRQKGRTLTVPIHPGRQDILLNWQQALEMAPVITTPEVDLGQGSVNTSLSMGLGQDRWVLFTMGPEFGPAVLFWGVLAVIVIVSLGLGKIRLTPLKSWHWFLLLIGLSQIPIESAVIVVAWLMILGWRSDRPIAQANYFNIMQVTIGLLTLISLSLLFDAVQQGLLGSPEMQITGNQSSAFNLNWYQDRSPSTLPTATLISVPLFVYRLLMLAWSLWLAFALLNWLKWGWKCYSSGGFWRKKPVKQEEAAAEQKK